ncbi:energy transducer TonB [Pedobacter sp. Du54]|uniref:energy transducer TonB n=1 Tax=Pedobacter anseongensis TaxID=3133439 RepID=UPI00309C999C
MVNILTAFLVCLSIGIYAQEPQLQGGLSVFLKENIVYPRYSLQNCIQGTVDIGFKLNKKGEVYYATITNGIGTDLDDEALRLIKLSSGKWNVPLDHDTSTLVLVPINFTLKGYDCERKDKYAIAKAISAYKVEAELINVIVNFYRNKQKGVFNAVEESKILKLRSDLGIDDEYLNRLLAKPIN